MWRERALKVMLVLVGLLFPAAIYPSILQFQASPQSFIQAHTWLRDQLLQRENILPVRAFGEYRSSGPIHRFGANGSRESTPDALNEVTCKEKDQD